MKPSGPLLSTLAALALAGCSGGGVPTASAFADSYCALFTDCCAQAGLKTDGQSCHSLVTLGAAQGAYDSKAGEKCIADLKAAQANAGFCANPNASSCDAVFGGGTAGTKKPGETCESDDDCAPSADGKVDCFSVFANGAETQTCMVQPDGKPGDSPCVATKRGNITSYQWNSARGAAPSTGYVCDTAQGVRCDDSTTPQACVALTDVGGSCTSSNACVVSAYCSAGKCVAKVAAGGTCVSSTECQDATYCDTTSKTCTQKIATGSACTTSAQCSSGSCTNMKCAAGLESLGLVFLCGN